MSGFLLVTTRCELEIEFITAFIERFLRESMGKNYLHFIGRAKFGKWN
jgi:hypothetical protein